MVELWKSSVSRGGEDYELIISWDTQSFNDGSPTISVRAVHRVDGREQDLELAVSPQQDEEDRPVLRVLFKDEVVVGVPLSDIIDADQFVELIPGWVYGGGNPIIGCLVRAGLSATVGQMLACRRETVESSWFGPRARAIGNCFRHEIGNVGSKAARRAARCLMRAGF